MDTDCGKNKLIRVIKGEEHILYEVSAEIVTVLHDEPLFHKTFRKVESYEDRIVESLSHTRSEGERSKSALELLKDLWFTRADAGPYLAPSLLADFEYERFFHPHYRDHTVHQLRVLLLGLYLYCRNRIIQEAIRKEVKQIFPGSLTADLIDDEFSRIWVLTAIYHDQGYIFSLSNKTIPNDHLARVYVEFNHFFEAPLSKYLLDHFGKEFPEARERRARAGLHLPQAFCIGSLDDLLLDPDGQTSVLDEIENLADPYKLNPSGKPLRKYFEMSRNELPLGENDSPHCDHGIISAIMLLRCHHELQHYVEDFARVGAGISQYIPDEEIRQILDLLGDSLTQSRSLIQHAAAAIAMHNIDPTIWAPETYTGPRYDLNLESFRLSLEHSPLAFLLSLCDTLQDWDRQRFTLPAGEHDYIRVDQHMLIAANEKEIAIRFYPTGHAGASQDIASFEKLQNVLCTRLRKEDIVRWTPLSRHQREQV